MFKNIKKFLLFSFLFVLVTFAFFVCLIFYDIYKTGFSTEETSLKYYSSNLKYPSDQENMVHFPKEIPQNAENVKYYYYSSGLGGITIFLQFKIDKEYIENEIKKTYFKKSSINKVSEYFYSARGRNKNADIKDYYYFYELDVDYSNAKPREYLFTGFGGIAIDKDYSNIFYYYVNPEG